jgi:hypothetical protein
MTNCLDMPVCEHNVPVKFHCNNCAKIKSKEDISILVERIDKLEAELKSKNQSRIEEEGRLRSSDEAIRSILKMMLERIDKLESENKMRQDTIACIDRTYDEEVNKLSDKFNELYKEILVVSSALFERNNEFFELRDECRKLVKGIKPMPHKCPVCEGNRICINKESGLSWDCQSCERKGIVWG